MSACDACGHQEISYNSCRNRHCPKCQASSRARWLEARAAELLPVPYFHVVFTLPAPLRPLALRNPRVVYGLLLKAAAESLLKVAANPQRLGARLGVLTVLHTWGQNLMHHPHVHCVVPGGGPALDGSHWIRCRDNFLLPVRVLSRVFRGKFLGLLRRARQRGRLVFSGALAPLVDDRAFERWLDDAVRSEWVVYAKAPFGGPVQVLKYLARYAHRVALSNQRLIELRNGRVRFRWKDYAQANRIGTMTLSANEFLRRFLLHVLPRGFVKIRHFGFLANRFRRRNLERIRALIVADQAETERAVGHAAPARAGMSGAEEAVGRCPRCHRGQMLLTERLLPCRPAAEQRALGSRELTNAPTDGVMQGSPAMLDSS